RQFKSDAATNGVNLSNKDLAYAFRNNISEAEFSQRIEKQGWIEQNRGLFIQFQKEAVRQGLPKPTEADLFKMLMGQGNKDFVELWNNAATTYSAKQGGIQMGRKAD